jgi:hypothetical protein
MGSGRGVASRTTRQRLPRKRQPRRDPGVVGARKGGSQTNLWLTSACRDSTEIIISRRLWYSISLPASPVAGRHPSACRPASVIISHVTLIGRRAARMARFSVVASPRSTKS